MLTDQLERVGNELERTVTRRRVVTTGAKLAYAAPLVAVSYKLSQRGALAASPVSCEHSLGGTGGGGCMQACSEPSPYAGCGGNQCDGFGGGDPQGPCATYCNLAGNVCCNAGLCDPANFTCSTSDGKASYHGSVAGC
jgi:hypothetical protein